MNFRSGMIFGLSAAFGGTWVERNGPRKTMFVAAALAVAAIELAWPMRKKPPREPTRSLGAIALVLGAGQVTDAARFLVLALLVLSPIATPILISLALFHGAVAYMGLRLTVELIAERAAKTGSGIRSESAAVGTGVVGWRLQRPLAPSG